MTRVFFDRVFCQLVTSKIFPECSDEILLDARAYIKNKMKVAAKTSNYFQELEFMMDSIDFVETANLDDIIRRFHGIQTNEKPNKDYFTIQSLDTIVSALKPVLSVEVYDNYAALVNSVRNQFRVVWNCTKCLEKINVMTEAFLKRLCQNIVLNLEHVDIISFCPFKCQCRGRREQKLDQHMSTYSSSRDLLSFQELYVQISRDSKMPMLSHQTSSFSYNMAWALDFFVRQITKHITPPSGSYSKWDFNDRREIIKAQKLPIPAIDLKTMHHNWASCISDSSHSSLFAKRELRTCSLGVMECYDPHCPKHGIPRNSRRRDHQNKDSQSRSLRGKKKRAKERFNRKQAVQKRVYVHSRTVNIQLSKCHQPNHLLEGNKNDENDELEWHAFANMFYLKLSPHSNGRYKRVRFVMYP